jgi:hypothetical protein
MFVSMTSGCSWTMMQSAPSDYDPSVAEHPPDCTASLGPAIGDTWDAIAVGGGLVATGSASIPLEIVDPLWGVAQIVAGTALGAMFGASANYGYSAYHRCRRLRDDFQTELYRRIETRDSSGGVER